MKNYLNSFFSEFEYEENDARVLISTYEKIQNSPMASKIFNEALKEYETNIDCDYNAIFDSVDRVADMLYVHEYTAGLLMFICMSRRLKERYLERGISLDVFRESVLDLKYKLEECKLIRSIVGVYPPSWFFGFFQMKRFAFGRLQFEIIELGYDYKKNGASFNRESKVISVHIPRNKKPLDKESCDEACQIAKEFFKGEYDAPCAFVCHSWLLYPENEKIIPEKTNIYRFMSRFDIIDSGVYKDNGNLWRLFDTEEKNYDKLPTDTSVRRAYVEHLKNGGKTGWGMGIFFA